jgi:quaternary ammonium compound-resistance protein SugE
MWKSWLCLVVAGLFEIVWAIWIQRTEGFRRPFPTAITLAAMLVSFYLLARAVRDLPIGTAYAVWTGIGAAGVALYGIVVLGEAASLPRILCLSLIVAGTLGLKLGHS